MGCAMPPFFFSNCIRMYNIFYIYKCFYEENSYLYPINFKNYFIVTSIIKITFSFYNVGPITKFNVIFDLHLKIFGLHPCCLVCANGTNMKGVETNFLFSSVSLSTWLAARGRGQREHNWCFYFFYTLFKLVLEKSEITLMPFSQLLCLV